MAVQEDNIERLRIGVRANIPDIAALFVKVSDQLMMDCQSVDRRHLSLLYLPFITAFSRWFAERFRIASVFYLSLIFIYNRSLGSIDNSILDASVYRTLSAYRRSKHRKSATSLIFDDIW